MHKHQKHLTKAQREQSWGVILKDWSISGKTAFAYCKANKIAMSCFYQWRNRLLPEHSKHNESKGIVDKQPLIGQFFVPVEVSSDSETLKGSTQGVTLHYPNGCYLHFKDDFDSIMLKKLNQAMGV